MIHASSNLYVALTGKDFVNVGPATASRLLSAFTPEELLAHLEIQNSEELRRIKGVSEKSILGLYRGYMVLKKKIKLARFLDKMQLPGEVVDKLYRLWGDQAIEKIRRNPYQLLFILPWEIIDKIGLSLGNRNHPCRLVGAVEMCTYEDYEQDKNTCITPLLLLEKVANLLGCDPEIARQAIWYALKVGAILKHGEVYQLPAAYSFERQIEHLLAKNRNYDISGDTVRRYLREGKYSRLTEEQVNVVVNALQNNKSAFYGRAGRGKTFTISAICDAATDLLGPKNRPVLPVLCAVAAKACQRMRKETGHDARTVASILCSRNFDLDSKIVIVDEASMLSLSDAFHLIKKIPETSRIVFLGDHSQIPSVDAGRVFYDIINRKAIPCVELTLNQRQDEKTDQQLEAILSGKFPEFEDFWPGAKTGLYRTVVKDVFAAEEEARRLFALFEGKAQIISPLNKYMGGSASINSLIHEKHYGRDGFCKGTPVIYTKNRGLTIKSSGRPVHMVNGSLGVITEVFKQSLTSWDPYLIVKFEVVGEVRLTLSEASDLEMAYCLTCHKAQGSEWDTVLIVLPKSDSLVDRNMIYTALSRCKVRAILIYYDHKYVANRIKAQASHERRRSALLGGYNV